MKPRAKYTVSYTRDGESGWWVAQVVGVKGCLTQGRTIEQARERIREALQAWFDLTEPYAGKLANTISLDRPLKASVDAAMKARNKAVHADTDASAKSRVAIRDLVKSGMSLRDAGELLGLTRQRAQQLLAR